MEKHSLKLSFEFFPPKTPNALQNLFLSATRLSELNPEFFSVTFGAGGSSKDKTWSTINFLQKNTKIKIIPHLTCVEMTKADIKDLLFNYKESGINHLLALRGDISAETKFKGDFSYANELVKFIRDETGNHFHIDVAAYPEFHPQTKHTHVDLQNFKRKIESGANGAITQYFYNADSYFRLIDDCKKLNIDAPIIPGIMPILNWSKLKEFSSKCGAEIPVWLCKRMESFGDDQESIKNYGIDVVTHLCEKLIAQGVPGFHFYTLNKSKPAITICKNLGIA